VSAVGSGLVGFRPATALAPGLNVGRSPVDVPRHIEVRERRSARDLAQGGVHGGAEPTGAERGLCRSQRGVVYVQTASAAAQTPPGCRFERPDAAQNGRRSRPGKDSEVAGRIEPDAITPAGRGKHGQSTSRNVLRRDRARACRRRQALGRRPSRAHRPPGHGYPIHAIAAVAAPGGLTAALGRRELRPRGGDPSLMRQRSLPGLVRWGAVRSCLNACRAVEPQAAPNHGRLVEARSHSGSHVSGAGHAALAAVGRGRILVWD